MRIHPLVAGLRRDPAPQLCAQAALEDIRERWRKREETAAVLSDLARYGAGAEIADCPSLWRLLSDLSQARGLIDALVTAFARALRQHPLGHVPMRHHYGKGLAVLQLAEANGATLALYAYEVRPSACAAQSVCFAGGDRHELCLAGAAQARVYRIAREGPDRAELSSEVRHIARGDCMESSGPRDTRILEALPGGVVLLRLSRPDAEPSPAREYRIDDGTLVHRASGDRRESRDEMAAAVLGAMRRADAAPVLAGMARAAGSEHLRWQALCHALALDTAAGFAALTGIAGDPADPVAPAARSLRATLVARHPVLSAEGARCPA